MLESPFAFYRGAARVMAADLAGAPRSGLTVQMCGDAHAANFGLYGSPERRLVFDANDFDETLPGPFEHDVKRLVASLVSAARGNGLGAGSGASSPSRPPPGTTATSVHAEFVGRSRYTDQGQRVVAGRRLMQQASDMFLGWQRTAGIDGVERDFYVRQLRDWKGAVEITELRPEGLTAYGGFCAWCLARAHARSGDRIAIAGYLGSSPAFAQAIADFAETYAEVNEGDHSQLAGAVAAGRVRAHSDL
jgi:uncharacterized protein DUF2252